MHDSNYDNYGLIVAIVEADKRHVVIVVDDVEANDSGGNELGSEGSEPEHSNNGYVKSIHNGPNSTEIVQFFCERSIFGMEENSHTEGKGPEAIVEDEVI